MIVHSTGSIKSLQNLYFSIWKNSYYLSYKHYLYFIGFRMETFSFAKQDIMLHHIFPQA